MDLVSKIAGGVAMAANAAGTLVVIALIAIVNYDILARGLFNAPFMGSTEIVQFSIVLIVFLQLPDVVRVGRLTRSDGFLVLMRRRSTRAAKAVSRFIDAISLAFMVIIAVAMWPEFVEMWRSNDFFGIPGVFTAPWWPVKLAIFLSAILCAVHFLLHVLRPMWVFETAEESGE